MRDIRPDVQEVGDGMKENTGVLAIDFGASSGRVMYGTYDGEQIHLQEVHRFTNDPVIVGDTMYWDVLRLFHEIKQGLVKAKKTGAYSSIGIDTWGVDFGLIDERGYLLENPVHYRDNRTKGMLEYGFSKIPEEEMYQITGNQFMEINTVFQLLALKSQRPELLERAKKLLLMPDLFNYLLTGETAAEYSIASTTQLLDAGRKQWSGRVLKALDLPKEILPEVVPSKTKIGKVRESICEELGIEPADVIAVAGHDTQSAMVAVPAQEKDFLFLSCGTWSLIGTELDEPLINEQSKKCNITNEGGFEGRISFLKNIIGLWMIQESRRQWIREGTEYGFGELEKMALEAEPLKCFIDPDDPVFLPAGNIPKRIREYCREKGQHIPTTAGEIVRCINESLAFKYRMAKEEIESCVGKTFYRLYLIGGGVQSALLCQLTANACNCEVVAGPVEATVLGNVILQLIESGAVKDLAEARRLVMASEDIKRFQPVDSSVWEEKYQEFKELFNEHVIQNV